MIHVKSEMAADNRMKPLFQINFSLLGIVVLSLPLLGFIFCVVWSVIYNFESSTATHCKVPNYLPSISSAIGGYTPQRYVWRICIALHCSPRLMTALAYYNFHTQIQVGKYNFHYQFLSGLCSVLHFLENLSLVGLTYISSIENHDQHEHLFIAFMVFSLVYMLLTCFVFHWGHTANGRLMSHPEQRSFRLKIGLLIFKILSFLVAVYMFFRHNNYCEPGIYTWFALCEYLIVLSNIAFHSTAILDFKFHDLKLASSHEVLTRISKRT